MATQKVAIFYWLCKAARLHKYRCENLHLFALNYTNTP